MPLTVIPLMQLGVVRRDYGITIIGATVVDDIIGIFILTALLGMETQGTISPPEMLVVTILIVFLFVSGGIYLGPMVGKGIFKRTMRFTSEERLGISLIFIFVFVIIADLAGLHAMIWAFMAGMAVRVILTRTEMETISKW